MRLYHDKHASQHICQQPNSVTFLVFDHWNTKRVVAVGVGCDRVVAKALEELLLSEYVESAEFVGTIGLRVRLHYGRAVNALGLVDALLAKVCHQIFTELIEETNCELNRDKTTLANNWETNGKQFDRWFDHRKSFRTLNTCLTLCQKRSVANELESSVDTVERKP